MTRQFRFLWVRWVSKLSASVRVKSRLSWCSFMLVCTGHRRLRTLNLFKLSEPATVHYRFKCACGSGSIREDVARGA